ncbi:FAD-dependent monooxygenase [Streptomyces sp. SRF1]|uniref:FAD-dependent monooxygenase n=1 Tax=Streptomyces sp. SRF1 TaxID=1549642 RepID=UPI0025AFDC02|nr:FAD-dependent monooxygenase [Streptomyces sp. SRF1]MDN3057010.1 FAD-dependent monooxygenase [Streptomyces sp. SRF1]
MINVPVLVVGGGPVGMSLALLLDRFGVPSLLVERRASTTTHPKARGCHARTMEQFRVWGIEDRIRRAGLPQESDVACWCESLNGPLVAYTQPAPSVNTPAPRSIVPQDAVEEALDHALSTRPGAQVRRLTELVSFVQDEEGVTARVRSVADGDEFAVRAQYLVGCDGANSRVRGLLGIEMDGPELLHLMANHYYRADVGHLPHVRSAIGFLVRPSDRSRPDVNVLATGPDGDRWLAVQKLEMGEEPISEERLIELVREYWEIPDLHVERINVMNWRMSAQVAKRFRKGRVFLAGDAAHRFPPAGGNGLNSGVQDVHNLAWKLVMALSHQGGDALLDTYESERRPVAQSNTDFAIRNQERMDTMDEAIRHRHEDPQAWRDLLLDMDNQLHSEGQSMGYVYNDGAIVDDGSFLPPYDSRHYWPTDRPGARFPHFWMDVEKTESSIDWFDTSFVLVCGPDGEGWHQAGEALRADGAVPLEVRKLPHLLGPVSIGRDGAVLVRPDGHVAWRATHAGDPRVLRDALTRVLAGGTRAPSVTGLAA